MVESWKERTELLVGEANLYKLASSVVAVIGLGGVGAYAAEMLCRAGVGTLILLDSDKVHETNKNRQLLATDSTLGMYKTEVISKRLIDINPKLNVKSYYRVSR
jgi:Dinucleotide-utilizing enzymes involved in molybdopterin and thiamine biosynthesis family 1